MDQPPECVCCRSAAEEMKQRKTHLGTVLHSETLELNLLMKTTGGTRRSSQYQNDVKTSYRE